MAHESLQNLSSYQTVEKCSLGANLITELRSKVMRGCKKKYTDKCPGCGQTFEASCLEDLKAIGVKQCGITENN